MCRKFVIISKIETVSIEELLKYIFSLSKIYVIFSILDIVTLATVYNSSVLQYRVISLLTILFYFLVTIILLLTSYSYHTESKKFADVKPANSMSHDYSHTYPSSITLLLCIGSTIILFLFNVFRIAFELNVSFNAFNLLFGLISLFLQAPTVYIMYKLREKIVNFHNDANSNSTTAILLNNENAA